MLTPEYLDALPDSVVELYAITERKIIADIARRITKEGYLTATGVWQTRKLKEIGSIESEMLKELQRATGRSKKELLSLFDDATMETLESDDAIHKLAGKEPIPFAKNKALQQVVKAGLKKTDGLFKNLTKTTANTATKQLENSLDLAYNNIISGAFSYDEAIKSSIKELTAKGLASVEYPSGHVDYLDVAVRRATLTGVNQTAVEVSFARCDEVGCDLVETTAHAGARPSHQEWQGKVFSRSGKSRKYPDFVESTKYGQGEGLAGWNCRHSHFPYYEGISKPSTSKEQLEKLNAETVKYNGKELSLYDAKQHQRYQERQIRKWKREADGLKAGGIDNSQARAKVSEWQKRQRSFLDQAGMKRDYKRERAGKQYK